MNHELWFNRDITCSVTVWKFGAPWTAKRHHWKSEADHHETPISKQQKINDFRTSSLAIFNEESEIDKRNIITSIVSLHRTVSSSIFIEHSALQRVDHLVLCYMYMYQESADHEKVLTGSFRAEALTLESSRNMSTVRTRCNVL